VAADAATQERDDEDRTTAIGLARYAYEYLEAAILVDKTIGETPGFAMVSPVRGCPEFCV